MKFKTIYLDVVQFEEEKQTYKFMTYPQIVHLLTQVRPYTDHLSFSLFEDVNYHPEITQIFQLAKTLNFRFDVDISKLKFLEVIEENLENNAISRVYISIANLEANACLKEAKNLDKLFDGIKRLNEHKIKVIITLPSKDPQFYHEHTLAFINKIGLDLNNELWQKGFQINISPLLMIRCNHSTPKRELVAPKRIGRCYGAVTMLGIMKNGNVIPCNHVNGQDIILGNIFESLFSEILASDKYIRISDGFYKNELVHPICQHCPKPRKRF